MVVERLRAKIAKPAIDKILLSIEWRISTPESQRVGATLRKMSAFYTAPIRLSISFRRQRCLSSGESFTTMPVTFTRPTDLGFRLVIACVSAHLPDPQIMHGLAAITLVSC